MYFVDRRKITEALDYMNRLIAIFESGTWERPLEELALERIGQNLIESMIDVGNQMIDGFIMRDPGGYEDVIDILEDESVLPDEEAEAIKQVIKMRKMLVMSYRSVDHERLKAVITDHLGALKRFSNRINRYLDQELGPVSAFSPDTGKEKSGKTGS